jgi:6-phosphogluconolactonase
MLERVQLAATRGEIPRNFAIDPGGAFLLAANQETDSIVSFRRDDDTGLLTETGHLVDVSMPVCLKMAYSTS